MSECLRFTDKNFQQEVLDSKVPVFVDFWGSWCPPCKMMEPIIDQLAKHFEGVIKVGKLNIDQNPAIRSKFNVSAAPTLALFKDAQILQRLVGARGKKQLVEMIETALEAQNTKSPPALDCNNPTK